MWELLWSFFDFLLGALDGAPSFACELHCTHTCTHTEMHQYSSVLIVVWAQQTLLDSSPPSNHFLIMPAFTVHMSLPNNKTKLHCVQHNLQAVLAAFRAPPLPLPLGKHDRSQTSTPTCCLLIWKAIFPFFLFCRVLTAVGRKSREGDFCFSSPHECTAELPPARLAWLNKT